MQQQYQCPTYFANFVVVRGFHIYIPFLEYNRADGAFFLQRGRTPKGLEADLSSDVTNYKEDL
jgi:hypothetical protein